MRAAVSPDPYPDIKEDGPRIVLGALSPPRDHPLYRRPADHNVAGLFIGGPAGEPCVLAFLVYFTHCAISAPTPENQRLQYVRYKGRAVEGRRVTNGGRYTRPVKPATSGRKKKAA